MIILRLSGIVRLAAVLFVFACSAAANIADSSRTVAVVNGEPILLESVERELMRVHMAGAQDEEMQRAEFDLDRLIQKMINDRLLAQEARAIGMDQDSKFTARVAAYRDRLAYRELLTELLPDTFTVSAAELQTAYNQYLQRFELRLLAVVDSTLMIQLAESLRAGESMERIAETYSIGRYKDKQGYAGIYPLFSLPVEIHEALITGQVGEFIGPNYLERIYVLFRIEGRLPPDSTVPVDSVRGMLETHVLTEKREAAHRALIEHFRRAIPVVVDSVLADSMLARMNAGAAAGLLPVVTVGANRTLSETDLRGKYIHKTVGKSNRSPREDLFGVVEAQIGVLVLQEAAARGDYGLRDVVANPTKDYADSMLVLAYLEDVLAGRVKVSDAEVAAYYDTTRSRFREPSTFRIATLTRTERDEAAADRQQLLAGTDFTWLAKRNSVDEMRDKGGDRPEISAEQLPPDMVAILDTLRIGSVTPPLKTDRGYMLIKLLDRREGPVRPLERVAETIRYHLERAKELQEIEATIKRLRASAVVEIRENVIRDLQITGPDE